MNKVLLSALFSITGFGCGISFEKWGPPPRPSGVSAQRMNPGYCVLACCVVVLALMSNGCREESEELLPFMEGRPSRLVVVFEKEADLREISSFMDEHTSATTPHPGGGHPLRPGIGAVRKVRINDHDGYEIGFDPSVSEERVAAIQDRMAESDLVQGVYKNLEIEEVRLRLEGGQELNNPKSPIDF